MNVSARIEFEKIENFRDLGGMVNTAGQRIRPGRLYRADALGAATANDREKLNSLGIIKIYDLRGPDEQQNHPDPKLEGAVHVSYPVMRTAEESGLEKNDLKKKNFIVEILERTAGMGNVGEKMMAANYADFVLSAYCQERYSKLLKDIYATLADNKDKSIVFHCTAGKDRTGFTAVLLEEILGIAREDIYADYLLTNTCLVNQPQEMMAKVRESFDLALADEELARIEDTVTAFMSARRLYLDTSYVSIEETYGSMDNYLRDILLISDEEKQAFCNLLLEE